MSELSDADLHRIVGFRLEYHGPPGRRKEHFEDGAQIVRNLRHAIALLPTTHAMSLTAPDWPAFAAAVTTAFCNSPTLSDFNRYADSVAVERAATQLLGLHRPEGCDPEHVTWAVDRAVARHWLEREFRGDEPCGLRPTLLGERTVQATGPAVIRPSAIERLKTFRRALNAFVAPMFEHGETREAGFESHEAVQDAWIDLADIVTAEWLLEFDAIEQTVGSLVPDHAFDVWRNAQQQISALILKVGREERLRIASKIASLQRGPVDPAAAAEVIIAATQRRPTDEPEAIDSIDDDDSPARNFSESASAIEYIGRDAAAALCGVTKGTLEKWIADDPAAPDPVRPGGGGKRHEYDYQTLRPWLERRSGRKLPEHYAGNGR